MFGENRRIVLDSLEGTLTETEDNNPLVCADVAHVPGPSNTLVQIALVPLARAQLLREPPVLLFNYVPEDLELESLGLEAEVAAQPMDLGNVLALNVMAEVPSGLDPDDLDQLFEEAYGRSFFVRLAEGAWDTKAVSGKPHAVYQLRLTPGDGTNLLTVQVMADRDGKCGAAQVVHKLNVMCGFEESLALG